jgi:hypothetical protein
MTTRMAKHRSKVALVLINVINHFEFSDGHKILRRARRFAPVLARLKARPIVAAFPSFTSTIISGSGVRTPGNLSTIA